MGHGSATETLLPPCSPVLPPHRGQPAVVMALLSPEATPITFPLSFSNGEMKG